jgi:hypothetical protein
MGVAVNAEARFAGEAEAEWGQVRYEANAETLPSPPRRCTDGRHIRSSVYKKSLDKKLFYFYYRFYSLYGSR